MTQHTVETEGIVIRVIPFDESHLVVRLMTKDQGMLSVIARHARRSKRRFGSQLDIFDRGIVKVSKGKGSMLSLESFLARNSLRHLRVDLVKLAAASVICESFDSLVKDGAENPAENYLLLTTALENVEQAGNPRLVFREAYMTLLNLLRVGGFSDDSPDDLPSSKGLERVLSKIESLTERELKSKAAIMQLITEAKAGNSNTAAWRR